MDKLRSIEEEKTGEAEQDPPFTQSGRRRQSEAAGQRQTEKLIRGSETE